MKLPILDLQMKKVGEAELPSQFTESYRPDLIRRAVLALQSGSRQAQGSSPEAGFRHSSSVSKRRRKYRGCYGAGISRVNRKILSRRGTRMHWVGAFSAQTVGGRRAHPPKAETNFIQKINQKENRKAVRSAMAATVDKVLVKERGHKIPEIYPFVIKKEIEKIAKTIEVKETLESFGFKEELKRTSVKKVRAGIGKLRGRKYRRKKGLLIVVGDDCPLLKAAKNIPGVNVAKVRSLNAELLAPGALPGRITLWTEQALSIIEKEKLFV